MYTLVMTNDTHIHTMAYFIPTWLISCYALHYITYKIFLLWGPQQPAEGGGFQNATRMRLGETFLSKA